MAFSYSSQNWDILMDSFCPISPVADIRCLLACSIICFKKSYCTVLMTLKKYSLGGPLPSGKTSGKYLVTSASP